MSLKGWIIKNAPERFLVDANLGERMITKPFDLRPKDPALAADPANWGGSRVHMAMLDFEAKFDGAFPSVVPFGSKPVCHAALKAANRFQHQVGEQNGTPVYEEVEDPYIAATLDEWKATGKIK